jgi:hypothetical protein
MRSSMRALWGALLLVVPATLVAGCGDDVGTGDQTQAKATTSSSSADAPCASSGGAVEPPEATALPDPPPGAKPCRRDPRLGGTVYVTTTPTGRSLLRYYGFGLRANDCETEPIGAASGLLASAGELELRFSCRNGGSGAVIAPKQGNRYVVTWRGESSIGD